MGLEKGPFVVAKSVSVEGDPYNPDTQGVILLPTDGSFVDVLTIDVCVKQPLKTRVIIDSMTQIAVITADGTFEVKYELLRKSSGNSDVLATINDEMDYQITNLRRHTNFPNFPIVDKNPSHGINTYVLRCTDLKCMIEFPPRVASRSLKATVITL
ncbi:hypothetical protein [Chengkuizengella axinellae]|uniref:Uncharacterized protein n=1 Tax=Chengkuizengella axinellae TaxID=3064388 RepID=A0ABT9IXC1_9BACL|nr:hypothetical protein [Chengkuizengella sp. 2205SS18-9]MDP5274013.1 hypothetical protein [Chengkuizengella sp. 2205SS18-9]